MSFIVKLLLYKDHKGKKGSFSLFVLFVLYYVADTMSALLVYMYDVLCCYVLCRNNSIYTDPNF